MYGYICCCIDTLCDHFITVDTPKLEEELGSPFRYPNRYAENDTDCDKASLWNDNDSIISMAYQNNQNTNNGDKHYCARFLFVCLTHILLRKLAQI